MSEPPFLFFLLLALLTVVRYLQTGMRNLAGHSAVVLGIAALTRFAAPALARHCVQSACDRQHDRKPQNCDVVVYGLISASIFMSWLHSANLERHSLGRSSGSTATWDSEEWLRQLRFAMRGFCRSGSYLLRAFLFIVLRRRCVSD